MKKTLLVFSCICSLFFVSCASKNIAQDENILQAPETITEAQADISTETDQDSPETSDTNTETDSDQEVLFIEEKVEFQEPEDFEEPVVITLLPEELVETESQDETPTEEKEEPLPEEKVEVELIPELENTSDSEVAEADTEDSLSPLANENADQETQKDSDIEVIDDISDSTESSDNTEDDVISVGDGEEGAVTGEEEETNNAEEITPSRKVTLKKMEYLDITYPGQGWIYMGITDGSKDLTYFGRKLGTENTKFTLQARNAGIKIVHFYKNDALSGQYIDDYIEVEILNQKGSNKTHIDAPEYKQPVPKKAKEKINKNQAKNDEEISMETSESSLVQTTSNSSNVSDSNSVSSIENDSKIEIQTSAPKETKIVEGVLEQEEEGRGGERTSSSSSSSSSSSIEKTEDKNSLTDSNTLLQEAQVLYNEKEYKLALEKINSFLESATSKRDLGLYLQGQILEAKSEVQNIKAAIEAYSTLTKNYPASKRWDDANKRMIYLKRFYLEVR